MQNLPTRSPRTGRASLPVLLAVLPLALMMPHVGAPSASGDRDESHPSVHGKRLSVGHEGRVTIIASATRWPRGATMALHGPVVVANGGSLTIEAGVRVEARVGASLVVTRDGRLVAEGTATEPIDLTCNSQPAFEGCWEGLTILGNALINAGTLSSPSARGTGPSGCRELAIDGGFGGCAADDSSGVLKYVRVQYAANGVRLLGVGSATVIDYLQVLRSFRTGIEVVGGSVPVRHLFLTGNRGNALAWSGGWDGKGQFIVAQQDPQRGGTAIRGTNDAGAGPDALPRSAPALYNITVLLPREGAETLALKLVAGTAGTFRNVIFYAPSIGLDIDDDPSCAQYVTGALALSHVITAGAIAVGAPEPPSLGCPTEAGLLADAALSNVVVTDPVQVAGLLKDPASLTLPDPRPAVGGAAELSVGVAPPADGFFDPGATFVGAVRPVSRNVATIPWFSGWTIPAPSAPGPDADGDDLLDFADNCPSVGNPSQSDGDGDTLGDACDPAVNAPDAPLVLTYMCDNTFRIRNPRARPVPTLEYQVYNATGRVVLPVVPAGAPDQAHFDAYFNSGVTGTVLLFENGTQVQVKANGGVVGCPPGLTPFLN